MSIFSDKPKTNTEEYTKDMLTPQQLSEAKSRFTNAIRGLREHIELSVDLIEEVRKASIKRVLEDSKLYRL